MNRKIRVIPAMIATAFAIALAATASAEVIFQYSVAPSGVVVAEGQTAVDVFFKEVLTEGSTTYFTGGLGLGSGAFAVQNMEGDSWVINDLLFNPAFDGSFNDKEVAATQARLTEAIDLSSAPVMLDAEGLALFGTIIFESVNSSGPTTWTINLYNENFGNVADSNGNPLDTDPGDGSFVPLAGGLTFDLPTPVPEPAGLAVMSLVMLGLGLRRRR